MSHEDLGGLGVFGPGTTPPAVRDAFRAARDATESDKPRHAATRSEAEKFFAKQAEEIKRAEAGQ